MMTYKEVYGVRKNVKCQKNLSWLQPFKSITYFFTELVIHKPKVVGSIPAPATNGIDIFNCDAVVT